MLPVITCEYPRETYKSRDGASLKCELGIDILSSHLQVISIQGINDFSPIDSYRYHNNLSFHLLLIIK